MLRARSAGIVEQALNAGLVQPEAGHDFVEDEQRALPRRNFPQELQVARIRHDEAHVAAIGLDDHAGDLPGKRSEAGFEGGAVIVG